MAAPTLTPLPAAPTRANPADFAARADTFMGALPTLVTQINALVAYWNTNLDTTAFINRNVASTMLQTLTFAMPPVLQASETTGDQVAFTISKGITQRQSVRIGNDGSLNLVPLNGAVALLKVNGQAVYHAGNKPTAADLGLVSAGSFTAANILDLLKTVDGAGSGVDADLLDGQQGAYYLNAANMTGTFADARAPSSIVRTSRNISTGDGLSGGGNLGTDRALSVDATVARRNSNNQFVGSQTVKGALHVDSPDDASLTQVLLRAFTGTMRGLLYSGPGSPDLILRSYTTDGVNFKNFVFNGSTGRLTAAEFAGNGSALSSLNAAALTGTIADARIPTSIVRNTISINPGDGLAGGGSLAATRTLSVDSTVVRTVRRVDAGNGLVGGGNMQVDRTISLGTPGTITADTANTTTTSSHTHSLPASAVGELISRLGLGAVGTYALMSIAQSGALASGTNIAGSALYYTNASGRIDHPGFFGTKTATGTWMLCGIISTYSNGDGNQVTLCKRIA